MYTVKPFTFLSDFQVEHTFTQLTFLIFVLKIFLNFFFFQFCSLGRLSHDVGWKYQDVIETLEAKRKVKAQDFYNRQVTKAKAVADAEKAVAAKAQPITAQIEAYGVRV